MLEMNEIKQIEKWTNKKLGEIIFDSDKDEWSENTSTFDTKLMNKSNVLILIEENKNGIKFGQFIYKKIDKLNDYVQDKRSFLYTFKDNDPKIFHNKKTRPYSISLFDKQHSYLAYIGNDIHLMKKGQQSFCNDGESTFFDYKGEINQLIGGTSNYTFFTPNRILVIQMK